MVLALDILETLKIAIQTFNQKPENHESSLSHSIRCDLMIDNAAPLLCRCSEIVLAHFHVRATSNQLNFRLSARCERKVSAVAEQLNVQCNAGDSKSMTCAFARNDLLLERRKSAV